VVGIDGSRHSNMALEWAVREGKLRDAIVRAICVAPPGSEDAFDWTVDDAMDQSKLTVHDAVESAALLEPTVVMRGEVLVGTVAETLTAASEVADLLVVGARGRGALSEFLLGSVSRSCIHKARCPVVVVHEMAWASNRVPPSRIVVEVGGAAGSDALSWAVEEAMLRSSQLEAVYDCATPHGEENAQVPPKECDDMAAYVSGLASSYIQGRGVGPFATSRALCASTASALLAACEGADLVVVGGSDPAAGNERSASALARRCVHSAPCPVVVVGRSARDVQ
jgi:nucleotide-binding universal stress UspA family protein